MKSPITTHVLDTSRGLPAANIPVTLFRYDDNPSNVDEISSAAAVKVGSGSTDEDGRIMQGLIDADHYRSGIYYLVFEVQRYFQPLGIEAFYPRVRIDFVVDSAQPHYHVPVLLSPFGFTTYRGS